MEEVKVAHDFLDYLQAFGGVASLAVAVIAAWFAWRSAQSADKSSDAAERTAQAAVVTAEVAKRETELLVAEHNRIPEAEISLEVEEMTARREGQVDVFLKLVAVNSGRKAAEGAIYGVFAPHSVEIRICRADRTLHEKQPKPTFQSAEKLEVDGEPQNTHALLKSTDLAPRVARVRHLRLTFSEPGRYQILGGVRHPDIPNGEARTLEEIRIPQIDLQENLS